ncbi:protein kinase [bacterium]|nr:protein kinase [bacterium]MCI0602903.1 protein kinase [bacterium]
MLRAYLSDRGFAVSTAGTGAEALWNLSQEKPDLMILDLVMPEMSGEHVCRLLKSDPALKDIIVFILTAKYDLQTKLNCFNMGAEEYLVKPLDMEELSARVTRFLEFSDRNKPVLASDERTMTIGIEDAEKTRQDSASVSTTPVMPGTNLQVAEKHKYGSYRVERLVGKGGMGLVYKAYDEHLDRFVALKVLSKQWTDNTEFVERFRREAKLIAAVNHPGIAQIYSLGQDQTEYYFALLWCPGGSLRDLIRNQQKIGFLKAVEIILQCARALAAARLKGVVHRDVKPSNIMFDENQQTKLVDFGIAHSEQVSANITVAQEILGSPAYMAPEQGRGDKVDHRADIYALGMTFFQMITGELPFFAETPMGWVIKHEKEPFPTFQQVQGKMHQKAYGIIQKMTRKAASDRYESYAELITDLETVQSELFRERQFKVPSASHIAPVPAAQGDNLFNVLLEIVKKNDSGILITRWGPLEKRFLILQGDLVLYESPQIEENVWKKIVERGILDPQNISLQNQNMEETLNRLLFLQALSLDDFTACYRPLMKTALLEVFRWPVVDVEFFKADIKQDSFCKIPLRAILMEGARNYVDFESIKNQVPYNRFIVRTWKFDEIFAGLELPATESFLASRIEGESVNLETLQLLTGFPIEQITRFIHALKGFDAIDFKSPEQRKPRRETTTPQPTPHPPGQPVFHEVTATPTPTPTPTPRISHAAESYYKLAEQAILKNDFWSAERLCKEAIELNPSEPKYYHMIGRAISHRHESAQLAEEFFRKAINLDPHNAEYRVTLADYFKDRGLIEMAIDECRQAIQISPENRRAAILLHALEKHQAHS